MALAGPAVNAVAVRPAGSGDVEHLATWHLAHFPTTFVARLGHRFLTTYYSALLDSPAGYAFVATLDGVPHGYICGTVDAAAHQAYLLGDARGRLLRAGTAALLRQPLLALDFARRRAPRYLRRLFLRGSRPAAAPGSAVGRVGTVDFLAVVPSGRGHGLGGRLLAAAVEHARASGTDRFELVAAADSTVGPDFYGKAGWTPAGTSSTREGRPLGRWHLPLRG